MAEIFLPGAYNDWSIATVQLNGGGVNWWIDTLPVDGAEVFRPLLAPPGYFDDVDLCFGFENRLRTLPYEARVVALTHEGRTFAFSFETHAFALKPESTVFAIPPETRTFVIKEAA